MSLKCHECKKMINAPSDMNPPTPDEYIQIFASSHTGLGRSIYFHPNCFEAIAGTEISSAVLPKEEKAKSQSDLWQNPSYYEKIRKEIQAATMAASSIPVFTSSQKELNKYEATYPYFKITKSRDKK